MNATVDTKNCSTKAAEMIKCRSCATCEFLEQDDDSDHFNCYHKNVKINSNEIHSSCENWMIPPEMSYVIKKLESYDKRY